MKRVFTLLLSIILLMTTIPGTSIVAFATEVDDMISVAKTEDDSIETNDEETKVSTEFETINVEAGRPQYFASSNSEIVLPEAAQITRAEWLHNLVVVFEMAVESESLPDNYFSDLESTHKYYEDILLAVEFGVVNIGVGEELKPDEGLTRDFAVSTLNFCLGYQLGENPEYTFSDSADCTNPDSAQIAVDRGWFELVDGCFLPESFVNIKIF
ncbi:MAG: S-layer homology domain-containing protein [Clostridia bacterium]|nr:S-layer homology domain-containing protein [Clostridia bacterium]